MIGQKKEYLKPLNLSNVMVALIKQRETIDRTQQLKQYLYKTIRLIDPQQYEAQQILLLPDFALEEMNESQLLQYHLDKGNWASNQYLNYQSLLDSINNKMAHTIQNSSQKFTRGQEMIEQLTAELKRLYEYLHEKRKSLHIVTQYVNKQENKIVVKLRKIQNMKKAMSVMKIWKSSNISRILRIRPDSVSFCADIKIIFQQFEQSFVFLNNNQNQLSSFSGIVNHLKQRKADLISSISLNIVNSIVDFTDEAEYHRKFQQYCIILDLGFIDKENNMLNQTNLSKLIQRNLSEIYYQLLNKKSGGHNLQLLNEEKYLDFFGEVMEEFSQYFSNWHKVTTYHLNKCTVYKEGFLRARTSVFQKSADRIANSLKYSGKFFALKLQNQLNLYEKINDFMECGEQWMGKVSTNLPGIMMQKLKYQNEQFLKINNGELKYLILEELAITSANGQLTKEQSKYLKQSQILKARHSLKQSGKKLLQKYTQTDIDFTKIAKMMSQQSGFFQSASIDQNQLQNSLKDILNLQPKLNTKLGLRFIQLILDYHFRQKFLPGKTQLLSIYEHFELMIIIIYKVCLPSSPKFHFERQLFNEQQRQNKLRQATGALAKGNIDDNLFALIDDLRGIFESRRSLGQFYYFLGSMGSKFDGISITTYVNSNKYYQNFQKYQEIVILLNERVLLILQQLYFIQNYLEKAISKGLFPKHCSHESIETKIINLKNVIPQFCLFYIGCYLHEVQKRMSLNVMPLFNNLKWDVKKMAVDTVVSFRDYKTRIMEIFRQSNLLPPGKSSVFINFIGLKQAECLFKFLIYLYSQIQKISDTGRDIIRSDLSDLNKLLFIDKNFNGGDNWMNHFDRYLQISRQRSQRGLIDKLQKVISIYPTNCWKCNFVWVFNDFSTKERKDFLAKLAGLYIQNILNQPKI